MVPSFLAKLLHFNLIIMLLQYLAVIKHPLDSLNFPPILLI